MLPDENTHPDMIEFPAMSWLEAWLTSLLKPSLQNYERLANDYNASLGRVFIWVFMTAFMTNTILKLLGEESLAQIEISGQDLGYSGLYLGAFITVALFLVITGVVHWLARSMNGQGTFTQLAYTCAAFYVPISLIETISYLIPGVVFSYLIPMFTSIYISILTLIAIKSVHSIGTLKALLAGSPVIVLNAIFILTGIFALSLSAIS